MTELPIKERIENILATRESKMFNYYKSFFIEGFSGGYPMDWDDDIINLFTTEQQNDKVAIVEALHAYSNWLHKNGYIDSDFYTKEPHAVDRFLAQPK